MTRVYEYHEPRLVCQKSIANKSDGFNTIKCRRSSDLVSRNYQTQRLPMLTIALIF